MAEVMTFPEMFDDFVNCYGFEDDKEAVSKSKTV